MVIKDLLTYLLTYLLITVLIIFSTVKLLITLSISTDLGARWLISPHNIWLDSRGTWDWEWVLCSCSDVHSEWA